VKPKSILHIASYYSGQRLYRNLIFSLNRHDIAQYVFVPVRSKEEVGKFQINDVDNVGFYYANILKPYHRFFYYTKIRRSFSALQQGVDLSRIGFVHAHSLFSDGGVALKVKRKFNIPYIVAVRNTDLNVFFKLMPHLRQFGLKILLEAESVVFINPSYKEQLLERYVPDIYKDVIRQKSICIPNGVDDFWHINPGTPKVFKGEVGRLAILYVGSFIPRKNVPLVINMALELNKRYDVTLTIVGGGGNGKVQKEDKTTRYAIELASKAGLSIELAGRVEDLSQLRLYYQSNDIFVMPSYGETFGLVYIEALTQGTPIIYAANEGVDGFFYDGQVGRAIHKFSVDELVHAVEFVLEDYKNISKRCLHATYDYQWRVISKQYLALYKIL